MQKTTHIPQWIGYKIFCYRTGLPEGNFKSLKTFIEMCY